MEINDIRTLAGLSPIMEAPEIHFDEETDREIDLKIASFTPEQRQMAYDALDILQGAGAAGIKGGAWLTQLKTLHPQADSAFLTTLTKLLINERIQRPEPGTFKWIVQGAEYHEPVDRNYAQPDENDPMFQMQNDYTVMAGHVMREAKRFSANGPVTLGGLARNLAGAKGIPLQVASTVVMQVISNNPRMFEKNPDGSYNFNDPVNKGGDAMATFRNIAATGKLPGQE